jgi:hypothetical protein
MVINSLPSYGSDSKSSSQSIDSRNDPPIVSYEEKPPQVTAVEAVTAKLSREDIRKQAHITDIDELARQLGVSLKYADGIDSVQTVC